MKYMGIFFPTGSGSLRGTTWSHNRGGTYVRGRTIPVNPNTPFQQAVRAHFPALAAAWLSDLTQGERDGWQAYADAVLIPDSLGEPRNIGGMPMYLRCNAARLQAGKTRIDVAPVILTIGVLTAPSFTVASATTASLVFTNTDVWAGAVGGHLFCYFSRGVNPTIQSFKGPYRFAAAVNGAASPPSSPATITLPFTIATGQRLYGRFVASDADGRLSNEVRATDVF
jgi:hypothetical protein